MTLSWLQKEDIDMKINRHQGMLHNCRNFSVIEHYQVRQIFYKQYPNWEDCPICVKCVIWKQIHKKYESVITDSWHTFQMGVVKC